MQAFLGTAVHMPMPHMRICPQPRLCATCVLPSTARPTRRCVRAERRTVSIPPRSCTLCSTLPSRTPAKRDSADRQSIEQKPPCFPHPTSRFRAQRTSRASNRAPELSESSKLSNESPEGEPNVANVVCSGYRGSQGTPAGQKALQPEGHKP